MIPSEPVRPGHPHKILVAEDEDLILRIFEGILKKAGFEVVGAEDGNKAAAIFDADPEGIDLVITDMALPGIPGDALAAHIRKSRPEMKIIFSSGCITDAPNRAIDELQNAMFLPKPFSFEELVAVVKKALATDLPTRANTPAANGVTMVDK
jgi:two-component system cell cycle sensor histidine kinase/response regulator CckA